MPNKQVNEDEIIEIHDKLRLRRYDGEHGFAFEWYQDSNTVMFVDGHADPYNLIQLDRMYSYLNEHGELYFIEVLEDGHFKPIGDVTFSRDDMPIVIGEAKYRGRGIGKLVITSLIDRAKTQGYHQLAVREIYDWNIHSQALFESCGFKKESKTAQGYRYTIDLDK